MNLLCSENEKRNESLVRASLVVVGKASTQEIGNMGRPPRPTSALSVPRPDSSLSVRDEQVAALYLSGNRKRSLGLGRVSYDENTPGAGNDGDPSQPSISRIRPQALLQSPRTRDHNEVLERAQRESELLYAALPQERPQQNIQDSQHRRDYHRSSSSERVDLREMQNLRDWNHTLTYELQKEREELNNLKTHLTDAEESRVEVQYLQDKHQELTNELTVQRNEFEKVKAKNEAFVHEVSVFVCELACMHAYMHVVLQGPPCFSQLFVPVWHLLTIFGVLKRHCCVFV